MQTQSVTRRRYASVNVTWPQGPLPKLEPKEAIAAAKRLYRFSMGKAFKGKVVLTSGNRNTWVRPSAKKVNGRYVGGWELRVNPDQGWREMVHCLSHYAHRKLHPNETGHGWHHARIEAAMIGKVISSGWLDGKLKRPEKAKPPAPAIRQQRTLTSISRWEAKLKRAETALKKLRARRAYYERKAA